MNFDSFQQITGTIQNISRSASCCTLTISLLTDRGPVNLILTGDTIVIDNVRLQRGMRIAAFYDPRLPVPAIFPPQFRAELIAVLRGNQNVILRYFDRTLTASDNSLRLNLTQRTDISTLNGQNFPCRPSNAELLVYFTSTTFSIPPQTTPQRVIVLCPFR